VDRLTLALVCLLILSGVIFSFSASPIAAPKAEPFNALYYTQRHFIFAILAVFVIVCVSMLSLKGIKRIGLSICGLALSLMAILPFIGHTAKGGRRWIELGAFSLQPSEFLKPALIVVISWMFAESQKGKGVPGVSIAFMLYVVSIGLLLIQPDVGQSILITLAFGACFFISGVPVRWILILLVIVLAALIVLFFILPHFRDRILQFINPDGEKYQVRSALNAIANGGFFGTGINEGTMKRFIPDLHTDFIFSVIAEEYGLVMILLLIGLYAIIIVRGLVKAMAMSDAFAQIAACGLYILLGTQTLINMSVNLGLIPPKGMTLPFLSYGGSSLLAIALTMGLILALTRKRPAEARLDNPQDW
jgi:cell division protein FtsW